MDMKKRARWLWAAAAIVILAALLINPALPEMRSDPGRGLLSTNPPPAEIVSMLRGACFDCHSTETRWPWYSHVAPMSWWLVDHVKEGRQRLNFSDWSHDDPRRAAKKWRLVADEVRSGDMPLHGYSWGHAEARLTAEQREQLAKWAEQEADRLGHLAQEP